MQLNDNFKQTLFGTFRNNSIQYPFHWKVISEITACCEQSFCVPRNKILIQLVYVFLLQGISYTLKSFCIRSVLVFQNGFFAIYR